MEETYIQQVLNNIIPLYYQYHMFNSIPKRTEKEEEELSSITKQLHTYYKILSDIVLSSPPSLKDTISLHLRKLKRSLHL